MRFPTGTERRTRLKLKVFDVPRAGIVAVTAIVAGSSGLTLIETRSGRCRRL